MLAKGLAKGLEGLKGLDGEEVLLIELVLLDDLNEALGLCQLQRGLSPQVRDPRVGTVQQQEIHKLLAVEEARHAQGRGTPLLALRILIYF